MRHPRTAVAALSLSALAFVGLITHEGFTEEAVIPTKDDRPTVGFGSTFNADGTPVKMGDTITPTKAARLSIQHIAKDEAKLKQCVKNDLHQAEYDILVDFAYQYGTKAACSSEMVKQINAGNYVAACEGYTRYRFAAGYDCSTLIDGKPNKRCWGVWERSKKRRDACMAAQ